MISASRFNGAFHMNGRLDKAWIWARGKGFGAGLEILVNFAAPFVVYTLAKPSLGDVHALMAASAPPIAWTIGVFALSRRIDALSIIALCGIALSLLAFAGGGGARFLQLREQLALAAIGLIFLTSAAIGKPLIYQLARARIKRRSLAESQSFEAMRENALFRRAMMVMTLVWGMGLVVDAAVSCGLIFVLTIEQYMVVSPIMGYSAIAALTAWTYWYARRAIGPIRGRE